MANCLFQPILFKRTKTSNWESGTKYIYMISNYEVIEDKDGNEISIDSVYKYKANWFGEV